MNERVARTGFIVRTAAPLTQLRTIPVAAELDGGPSCPLSKKKEKRKKEKKKIK